MLHHAGPNIVAPLAADHITQPVKSEFADAAHYFRLSANSNLRYLSGISRRFFYCQSRPALASERPLPRQANAILQHAYYPSWNCLLPETELNDGLVVIPLPDARSLIAPGQELEVCVGSRIYTERCRRGDTRSYALNHPGRELRSGLAAELNWESAGYRSEFYRRCSKIEERIYNAVLAVLERLEPDNPLREMAAAYQAARTVKATRQQPSFIRVK